MNRCPWGGHLPNLRNLFASEPCDRLNVLVILDEYTRHTLTHHCGGRLGLLLALVTRCMERHRAAAVLQCVAAYRSRSRIPDRDNPRRSTVNLTTCSTKHAMHHTAWFDCRTHQTHQHDDDTTGTRSRLPAAAHCTLCPCLLHHIRLRSTRLMIPPDLPSDSLRIDTHRS